MMEQKIDGTEDLPAGENLILSVSSARTARTRRTSTGILSLYHGDQSRRRPDQDPARMFPSLAKAWRGPRQRRTGNR
jgi:hypothetical protein